MSKPDGRQTRRRRTTATPSDDRRVIVEDVDGVTCVLRTQTPLSEPERQAVRAFVERVLLNVDGEKLADVTIPSLLTIDDTERVTAWLDEDPARFRLVAGNGCDRHAKVPSRYCVDCAARAGL